MRFLPPFSWLLILVNNKRVIVAILCHCKWCQSLSALPSFGESRRPPLRLPRAVVPWYLPRAVVPPSRLYGGFWWDGRPWRSRSEMSSLFWFDSIFVNLWFYFPVFGTASLRKRTKVVQFSTSSLVILCDPIFYRTSLVWLVWACPRLKIEPR